MTALWRAIESRAWLGFTAVVIAGIVIGWLINTHVTRLQEDRNAVARTNQTLNTIDAALSALQEVESGQHGYVITASPEYLAKINDGVGATAENLSHLKGLMVQEPLQQGRVAALEALAGQEISFARESVATRDNGGKEQAEQLITSGQGKAVMDEAWALVRDMQRTETDRLAQRNNSSDAATRNSTILMLALAIASLSLFGSLLLAVTRSLASQRRAAEAAASLGAIVGASSDAIISVDLDGHVTSWNSAAERIFRYPGPEILGQHISTITPPDHAAQQETNLAAARAGQEVVDQETVCLTMDGRLVDVSVSSFPLRSASGDVTGLAGVFRDITERKQAEASLRDWQQRFATVFDVSPVGISISRASDGLIIDANRRILDMLGFEREDVVGHSSVDLGVWVDHSVRAAMVQRIREEGSLLDVGLQWRTSSGRLIDTITACKMLEVDGETCLLNVVQDISASKEAERDRERLFTLSSDLIAVVDFDGRFRGANPAARKTFGYTEGELLGLPVLDLVHPEDRDHAAAALGRLVAGEPTVTFEGRTRAKDGSYRWVELAAAGDPEQQLAYLVARDTTRRREMGDALRISEERFRSVVETAEDAIIVIDSDGVIEAFNQAAESIFGYFANEAVGANVSMLMPSPHREAHDGYIARFLATGERRLTRNRELIGLRKDGTEFPMEFTVSEVRAGGDLRFTGIVRDISTRKRMESELREARELAEEANRTKSAFLSRMSHELRTPLNVVLGFGQVLQLDRLDTQQAEAVDYILTAGRHLLELIDEVLDISRIEAGRLSLSIEPVRADELVSETLALMRPLADRRNVTISYDVSLCAAFILADRQRLKQVLLNLFSNAIKYNKEGGSVAIACLSDGDSALRIMVTDTGAGIAPEQLDRVFSPFDRLGAEATGVEGTGLGLTLSRHLVEAMGGAIGLESAVGMGTSFWVELPLGSPPEVPETKTRATVPPETDRIMDGRSILYVEDNLANLKVMERILTQQKGYHLLAAMQGRLGIELARDHHPDLILLDLHLPDMIGSDVLRELKTHPATAGIPVVIISADASPGLGAHLLDTGARAYVAKPLDLLEFLDLTDSILREEA